MTVFMLRGALFCAAALLPIAANATIMGQPLTVNCSTTRLSSIISGITNGDIQFGGAITINASGTCSDHIYIPMGWNFVINGTPSTVITGDTASSATITNDGGRLSLRNIRVTTSFASQEVITTWAGGSTGIYGSTIVGGAAKNAIAVTAAATTTIENSTITSTGNSAVNIGGGGYAWINTTSGHYTTISYNGSGGQALGCWEGTFDLTTEGTGIATIGPSTSTGIASRGCRATIGGGNSRKNSVRITGASDAGLRAKAGDFYNIINTRMFSNAGSTIELSAGTIEIDNSTIVVPEAAGIRALRGAIIFFNHIYGTSSVSGPTPYRCNQGGKIYADVGFAPTGGATSPGGCLSIGGTSTN